ncbi:MAG: hypothetical protein FWH47_08175, partial [Methanomassiliicoccaceae archaeon]|nr:hypothetical protein [Methanomassiliicoccaceae archaeon]
GDVVLERAVQAGASVTIEGGGGISNGAGRFVGWNAEPDMSGSVYLPGSQLRLYRDVSLYAMLVDSEVYAVILPENQVGYTMTADPATVASGGSTIITFTLLPSHMDDDMVIAVNGNPMKLNALREIHLLDVTEDKVVTVTGVYDKRMHSITLPDDQRGYSLTASAESVHHGEPYTLQYALLPGYWETTDFGIHISGVDTRTPSGGAVTIEDVRDNHVITVTGIEPIRYNVAAGSNIAAYVDGAVAAKATVEDIVVILPAEGYEIPGTFNSHITGGFKVSGEGYRITGDVAFPSVWKVSAGDNVLADGGKAAFVCPGDRVTVSAAAGYWLPDDYPDAVRALDGAAYSPPRYTFSKDATLPSVYKVVYNGYNSVHDTICVVDGSEVPSPIDAPKRLAYYFVGWDAAPLPVTSNMSVQSIWEPMVHDVFFGPNLIVQVGNMFYLFDEDSLNNKPRTIQIRTDEKVIIENYFELPLPDNYGPIGNASYRGGYYEIMGDCSFPGITTVKYLENGTLDGIEEPAVIGCAYNVLREPTVNKEGYTFERWLHNDVPVGDVIFVENIRYLLIPEWSPNDG